MHHVKRKRKARRTSDLHVGYHGCLYTHGQLIFGHIHLCLTCNPEGIRIRKKQRNRWKCQDGSKIITWCLQTKQRSTGIYAYTVNSWMHNKEKARRSSKLYQRGFQSPCILIFSFQILLGKLRTEPHSRPLYQLSLIDQPKRYLCFPAYATPQE